MAQRAGRIGAQGRGDIMRVKGSLDRVIRRWETLYE